MTQSQDIQAPAPRFRRFLWRMVVFSLVTAAGLLAAVILQGTLDTPFWKLFLTFTGTGIGALLMAIQVGALPRRSQTVVLGAAVIILSQLCFFLLVWTGWKHHGWLWRAWWITMIPSVFVTHMLLLRGATYGRERRGRVEQLTLWCVFLAGCLTLALAFRRDLFGPLSTVYLIFLSFFAFFTVGGSLYTAFRWLLGRIGTEQLSKRALAGGLMMSHLLLLLTGFFVGRAIGGKNTERPYQFVKEMPDAVTQKMNRDIYKAQSGIATWFGDTRLVEREPYISPPQIEKISQQLQPGDIFLERRNWYLSNPWLPGFWPHAALYIGTPGDLKRLGIYHHPNLQRYIRDYASPTPEGHQKTIIEAVSEGVIFNSLEHSAHADYLAVLRPRLTDKQKAAAIVRAFGHVGKPYDFNFDFDDTGKLVCTQLVYLAYEGMIPFPLKRIMGRRTLPANEIAATFTLDKKQPRRLLDFVLFLDAAPREKRAHFSDEENFCRSINRPRAIIE